MRGGDWREPCHLESPWFCSETSSHQFIMSVDEGKVDLQSPNFLA